MLNKENIQFEDLLKSSISIEDSKEKTAFLKKKRSFDEANEKNYKKRRICSICRAGGELVTCGRCPKSFHLACLKLKDNDKVSFFCANCLPVIERKRKRLEESEIRKKEKENLKKQKEILLLKNVEKKNEMKVSEDVNFDFVQIKYDGRRLLDGVEDEKMMEMRLEEMNEMDFIIEEVIKKEKVVEFVLSYLKKAEQVGDETAKKFRPVFGNVDKKKKKRKMLIRKRQIKGKQGLIPNEKESKKEKGKKEEEKKYINVKYPIEDKELYMNYKKYQLEEKYLSKPKGINMIIPNDMYMKIYKIYDFLITFSEPLKLSNDYTLDMLYMSFETKSETQLLKEIVFSLLSLLIDFIIQTDEEADGEEKKINDKDLLMIKSIFSYTKHRKDRLLSTVFPEVMKIFLESEKFSDLIKEDLRLIVRKVNEISSFYFLEIYEKMRILDGLILISLKTDQIRRVIEEDILKKHELKKERQLIETEIKSVDNRKKELERAEKQTNPKEKIEILNGKLQSLNEDETLNRKEASKLRKEIELEREEYRNMIKEIEEIDVKRNKYVLKLEKLMIDWYVLSNNSRRKIGIDGYGNEYYLFKSKGLFQIHVKNTLNQWGGFNSLSQVNDLLGRLSEKGRNEKGIIDYIKGLSLKMFNFDDDFSNFSSDEYKQRTLNRILNWQNGFSISLQSTQTQATTVQVAVSSLLIQSQQNISQSHHMQLDKDQQIQQPQFQYISLILEYIELFEKSYSSFLQKENKEWDLYQVKEEVMAYIRNSSTVFSFRNILLFLNNAFKKPIHLKQKQNKQSKAKVMKDDDEQMSSNQLYPIVLDENNSLIQDYKENFSEVNKEYESMIVNNHSNIWVKYKEIDMENFFIEKVLEANSYSQILILTMFFHSLITCLSKEKEENSKKTQKHDNNTCSESGKLERKDENLCFDDFLIEESKLRTRRQLKQFSQINVEDDLLGRLKGKSRMIEWSDECMLCGEGGKIILCENCPNAVHLECIGLDTEPDDWFCDGCIFDLGRRKSKRNCVGNKIR